MEKFNKKQNIKMEKDWIKKNYFHNEVSLWDEKYKDKELISSKLLLA